MKIIIKGVESTDHQDSLLNFKTLLRKMKMLNEVAILIDYTLKLID